MGEVVNYPLHYREFVKEDGNEIVVYNPKSQRVVLGDDKYMNRQINGLTLELMQEGYEMGDHGRFDSNG